MDLGLVDKVAVITGGSEGVGKGIAACLAREGAKVAVCARRADVLEQAAAELREQTGAEILALAADVSDAADIERFIAQVAAQFGRIDILVNNAGRSFAKPFEALDDADWDADLGLKFTAAVRCSRAVIPHMRQVGGGRIINITHPGGKAPSAGSLPTSVSRAAGIALSKAMSQDYAGENILVNTVCLNSIKSAQTQRFWEARGGDDSLEAFERKMGQRVPVGRLGEPEEVGALVAFLASGHAGFITGTAVNIDGGASPVV